MEKVIAKRYKVLQRLGTGGMGSVFLCLDIKTNKQVVLKILNEALIGTGHNTQRFLDEGKKSKRLKHQNIVSVFDYGKDGNIYFIAMEYIKGSTVKEIIKKKQPSYIPIPLVKKILISTLYALSFARKKGIVAHRDVKSQNIMIDSKGIVKLLDFGNSKAIGFDTYPTRWLTPEYESPEQGFPTKFRNKIDIRSDIYSFGIVMYEMLTNRLPFTGSAGEVSEKHLRQICPNPLNFRKDIPKGLISIMYKALEKDPNRRYQTPEEMIRDLQKGYAANYEMPTLTSNTQEESTTVPSYKHRTYGGNSSAQVSVSYPFQRAVKPQRTKILPLMVGLGVLVLIIALAFLPHTHSAPSLPPAPSGTSAIANIPSNVSYIYPLSNSICYYTKDDPATLRSSLYAYNGKKALLFEEFDYIISCFSVSNDKKFIAVVGGKDSNNFPQPVLRIFDSRKKCIYETLPAIGNVTFVTFKDEYNVLFTASKSNNASDIYLLNIKFKKISKIVSNGHENLFPFASDNNLYYIDRSKNSQLIIRDLNNGSTKYTNLYSVSIFGVNGNKILYVDRGTGDVYSATISDGQISDETVVFKNKNNVMVIRVYPSSIGYYLLQTKAGKYWIEEVKG